MVVKRRVRSIRVQISFTPKSFLKVLDEFVREERKMREFSRSQAITEGLKYLMDSKGFNWKKKLEEMELETLDLTK